MKSMILRASGLFIIAALSGCAANADTSAIGTASGLEEGALPHVGPSQWQTALPTCEDSSVDSGDVAVADGSGGLVAVVGGTNNKVICIDTAEALASEIAAVGGRIIAGHISLFATRIHGNGDTSEGDPHPQPNVPAWQYAGDPHPQPNGPTSAYGDPHPQPNSPVLTTSAWFQDLTGTASSDPHPQPNRGAHTN